MCSADFIRETPGMWMEKNSNLEASASLRPPLNSSETKTTPPGLMGKRGKAHPKKKDAESSLKKLKTPPTASPLKNCNSRGAFSGKTP